MAAPVGHSQVRGDSDSGEEEVQIRVSHTHGGAGSKAHGFSPLDIEESPGGQATSPAHTGVADEMDGIRRGGRGGGHARLESAWERSARRNDRLLFGALAAVAGLLAILVGLVAVAVHKGLHVGDSGAITYAQDGEEIDSGEAIQVSRIAFGSCTSTGVQDDPGQPIWTRAVIPAEPDAWIWAGDMAYLDHPTANCELLPDDPDCVCRENFMRVEPWCAVGDVNHGLRKFQTMIRNPEYNQFLDYMCPAARGLGMTPPPGTDLRYCPRTILGTWDDHDFGWNDGDGRLEQKWLFKNMYLDAVGEDRDSPRRNAHQGMWHKHILNRGTDREIEVFLLDERYYRTPKPCYVRRQFCEKILEEMDAEVAASTNETALPSNSHAIWCTDFLRAGHGGKGSCCSQDENIANGWCLREASRDSPYWEEACDTSSRDFGKRWLVYDEGTGEVREPDGTEEVDSQDSPFCEMLGREQRSWLQRELDQSTASLRLVVSGSVVLGKPGNASHECDGEPCQCSGDDWDCYHPAQKNLLSQLSEAPGCTVILTGDYHWGDIKAIMPGADTPYAEWYSSEDNEFPIYQVMASGMTTSTAKKGRECDGFIRDEPGLRTHPECDMVLDPNFGLIQVKFGDSGSFSSLEMQIRDWDGTVRLTSTLSADMCNPRRTS